MNGSGLALVIIPVAAPAGLVAWLIMVFSADGHPRQADRDPAITPASARGKPQNACPRWQPPRIRPSEIAASDAPGRLFQARIVRARQKERRARSAA